MLIIIAIITLFAIRAAWIDKNWRKCWAIGAILLLASIVCLYIGEHFTSVDEQGVLHEAGLFLPTGIVLLLLGSVELAFTRIQKSFRFK